MTLLFGKLIEGIFGVQGEIVAN